MAEIKTRTGEDLKTMLEELYAWYFKNAQELDRQDSSYWYNEYKIGVCDGCIQMLDTIYFALYGGKAAMGNWLKNIGVETVKRAEMLKEAFPNDKATNGV